MFRFASGRAEVTYVTGAIELEPPAHGARGHLAVPPVDEAHFCGGVEGGRTTRGVCLLGEARDTGAHSLYKTGGPAKGR